MKKIYLQKNARIPAIIRISIFAFLLLAMSLNGSTQSIFANLIADANPSTSNPFTTGQSVNANITASGIGRGSGITANAGADRYNAKDWATATDIDANDYFTFTLTPNPGFKINFTSFTCTAQRSGTGPTVFAFKSSADNFGSSIGSPTATTSNISLTAAAYQNVTSAITFRFYGWTSGGAAGTFSINDFIFNGTVVSACSNGTISLTSGNASPTVGLNTAMTNIVYTVGGGATSASVSGLPTGITGSYSSGPKTFTISGTPSVTGNFPYTVTATGGCSPVPAIGTITVNPVVPALTSTTATSITTSGASSGGTNISDGGSTVTAKGVAYGTSPAPTISGTKTTNGSGIANFTSAITGLTPNTQYFYRAYATNTIGTGYGTESNFNTLAAVPAAPVVNGATTSSLNITVSANGNPVSTTYAIQETTSGNYVQANGTLGASAVWQTAATWGIKTIPALVASQPYNFRVKARNTDNAESAFGSIATKSTLANIPGSPIVDGATFSTLNVTVDPNNNAAFAEYAIYEATTGNFVQADGTLGGSPSWQIADLWGTKTVVDLASVTQYTFQVSARNADLIETVLGAGTDGTTLDAFTAFLSATSLNDFGNVCISSTISSSFILSGENLLADDIVISALNGYSYSSDQSGPYSSTLTLSHPGGSYSQEIFVHFSPTADQSYNGAIIVSGGGADNININVTGNGINTTATVVSTGVSGIGINGATVSANITLTGCTPATAYGVEYSTVPSFVNGTGTPVPGSNLNTGSFSVNLGSLNTGTVYYYHAYATNDGGTSYSNEGTFTTVNPSLNASTLSSFGNVCIGNTAGPNTFIITGANLSAANVTIASLNGYSYSTDDNQYFPSLSISQPGGSFSQTIYVKFNPLVAQSYNGNVAIDGGGATGTNVAVTGTGINTSASVTTGTATAVSQLSATAAGNITSIGCSAIATYGIEYSTNNGFANGSGTQVSGSNLAVNAFSVVVNGLNPGITYYYKAYATNNGGTAYGIQQSFITSALDAPVATNATNITGTSFTANWNPVNGATSYRLDVSTNINFVDPNSVANTTLAGWTFPVAPSGASVVADIFTTNNSTRTLTTTSGTGSMGSVTGNPGLAATNTGWDAGVDTKYWQVDVNTTGYYGLTISSQQQSSGTGPANFKLQYRVGSTGSFTDVPGGAINVQNNFTSGVVTNLALPVVCYNQPLLYIRWTIASTSSVNVGGTVGSAGTSRIDNILVKGGNTPLFIPGYNNLTVNGTSQSVTGLTANTNYYYRARAFSATNTSPNSNTINAFTCFIVPAITGNASFCQGTSTVLTSSVASTYQWNLNGNPINGETNQTISITSAGDYTVTVTNATGCTGTSTVTTVTVNPVPATPTINAGGPIIFCAGGSVLLTSSAETGNQWNLDGAPIPGQNNKTLAVNASGDYTVTVANEFGCSAISASTSVTVNPLPATATATVIQPTCSLGTGTINVTSPLGAGNSYNLDGSASYQSSPGFPGVAPGDHAIGVRNSFGCSSAAVVTVTVNSQPFIPAAPIVTGIVNVCPFLGTGDQVTYTAATTGNGTITYNWTLPPNVTVISGGGTNSPNNFVTITFPANFASQANKQIRLTATNECGTSTLAIYYLLTQYPHTPNPITGQTNVCTLIGTANTATYTTNRSAGAIAYAWSIPGFASMVHPSTGADDTTIIVTFNPGFMGGLVSVTATNGCGVSPTRTLNILNAIPVTPSLINGPTNACSNMVPGGVAATYSVPAVPFATSYTWTTPAGSIVTHPNGAGANDFTITVFFPDTFTSGAITVMATNGCGNSGIRSLALTKLNPATPGVIDVIQQQFCGDPGGRTFTYTLASMPASATSVIWTVPGGATFINLSAISILVTYPDASVNGSVTAQASSNCGLSTVRSTKVKLPECPPTDFARNNNYKTQIKGSIVPSVITEKKMEMKIYPNPAINDFKLEVLTAKTEEIHVRVMDGQGRVVKSFTLMPYQVIVLGNDLKTGVYLIEARQGNKVITEKVVRF